MNIKELRQVRRQLVARFKMADNAPTGSAVKTAMVEEMVEAAL